jgi:hypothetical protein
LILLNPFFQQTIGFYFPGIDESRFAFLKAFRGGDKGSVFIVKCLGHGYTHSALNGESQRMGQLKKSNEDAFVFLSTDLREFYDRFLD